MQEFINSGKLTPAQIQALIAEEFFSKKFDSLFSLDIEHGTGSGKQQDT